MPPSPDDIDLVPVEIIEPPRPAPERLVDRPVLLLALLFGGTAALGLPLLWQSRAFSWQAKLLWSLTLLAYTALILWLFAVVMTWCWSRIAEPLGWS